MADIINHLRGLIDSRESLLMAARNALTRLDR